jgi:hypothetical protein
MRSAIVAPFAESFASMLRACVFSSTFEIMITLPSKNVKWFAPFFLLKAATDAGEAVYTLPLVLSENATYVTSGLHASALAGDG